MKALCYTYGLGGRDFTVERVYEVFDELKDMIENNKEFRQHRYVGLRTNSPEVR